jgi:DNA polymerase III subunit gamma/tau
MALARLAYAADLPGPEEALRKLGDGGAIPAPAPRAPPAPVGGPQAAALAPVASAPPGPTLARFADVVALARSRRDLAFVRALEHDMRVVRYEPGRIEFTPNADAAPTLAATLAKKLQDWTGQRWMVAVVPGGVAPTLRESAAAAEEQKREGVAAHPVVRKVLDQFPGAKIVAVRAPETAPPEAPPPTDEDVGYAEPLDEDL